MVRRHLSTLATHVIDITIRQVRGKVIWREVVELRTNQESLQKIIKTPPTIGLEGSCGGKKNNLQGPSPNKYNILI